MILRLSKWINMLVVLMALGVIAVYIKMSMIEGAFLSSKLYFVYIFLSLALAILFVLYFIKPALKVKLAFSFLICVIFLYIFELILTFIAPFDLRKQLVRAAAKAGVEFDGRTVLQVVDDLNNEGGDVVPSLIPSHLLDSNELKSFSIFPLGGISDKLTVLGNESGKYAIYHADEHGFNNVKGLYGKPRDLELVLVGDSFLHGAHVNPGEDITGQLRKKGVRALNLGIAGSSLLIQYAMIREYGRVLKPKKVAIVYFEGNDLEELGVEMNSSYLMKYLEDKNFHQNLMGRQALADEALIENYLLSRKTHMERSSFSFVNMLIFSQIRMVLGLTYKPPRPIKFYEKVLGEFKQTVESWGGELVFVYIPYGMRYVANTEDSAYSRLEILEVVKKTNISLIDLHEMLKVSPEPMKYYPFRVPAHFNKDGYNAVAEYIKSKINKGVEPRVLSFKESKYP